MMAYTITLKTLMGHGKKFELASMKSDKLSCQTSASHHTTKSKVYA